MSYNDDLFLIVYFLIGVSVLLIKKRSLLSKYYLFYALICISFLFIHPFLLNNLNSININFGYALKVITFLLVISVLGYNNFSNTYLNIIFLLSCFNLVLYFDQTFLFKLSRPLSGFLTTFDNNVLYENYIFYVKQTISLSYENFNPNTWIKNSGIFGEGGLYQYFLNLALIINLYFYNKPILSFKSIILIISILTTFSTVGYIIMVAVLCFTVMGESTENYRKLKIVLIIPSLLFLLFSDVIVNKLYKTDSTAFFSTQRRILDTIIDYNIIKEQPILGIGLGNIKKYKEYSSKYAGGGSSSNGLTHYIANIGLLGFIITLYPFIFINIKGKKNKIILLCNGLTLITQGIIFTPIFLLSMSLLNQKE